MSGATFVLVHGMSHGAWCWFKLKPELEALGHRVVTLDLPALGEDQTPIADVTLAMNVDRVAEVIRQQGKPVVLLGHSLGGATVTATAERIPEGIVRLIYLTAFIPRNGESVNMIGTWPSWSHGTGPSALVRSADGLSIAFSPEGLRDRLYNGCSDEDAAYCLARLRPQPFVIRDTPVTTTPERFGRIPRAFIHCSEDRSIPPAVQREMVERSPCDKVATLPSGHSSFVSMPDRLAGTLSDIVS